MTKSEQRGLFSLHGLLTMRAMLCSVLCMLACMLCPSVLQVLAMDSLELQCRPFTCHL